VDFCTTTKGRKKSIN